MATIYEVSTLAGVSLATVSRVSDKTRQKVLDAMNELDYRPNSIAQSLASNRTNSVGILVSELHGAFFGQMMAGIESELRAAGKHVIITTGHSEEDKEKDGIESRWILTVRKNSSRDSERGRKNAGESELCS